MKPLIVLRNEIKAETVSGNRFALKTKAEEIIRLIPIQEEGKAH